MSLQIRRYKDIVAFKEGPGPAIAFHSSNMEVAEITEDVWNIMKDSSLQSSEATPDLQIKDEKLSQQDQGQSASQELTDWQNFQNPEVQSGATAFGIKSLTINVTQICNLHCTYCAAGGDGSFGDPMKKISVEKTLPQIQFFMNRLKEGDRFHISFLGGEPMLYPEALKMIGEYAQALAHEKKLNLTMKVTTNGTLMSDEIYKILTDLGINVVVSLDGPPEINDLTRPQKNKKPITETVAQNLRWMLSQRHRKISIAIHGVFNQNNMQIEKAYDYYQSLGADWFEFTYAVDTHSSELNQNYISQMKKIAEKAIQKGGEAELRKISVFDQYFKALDQQQRTENHCGIGKSLLIVDARNRLYNCPWTVGQKADQMGEGQELFTDKLDEYQNSLIERNSCQSCWARFICGGGCSFIHQSKTGSKTNKDQDFCFRTRSLISISIMYYNHFREDQYGKETH